MTSVTTDQRQGVNSSQAVKVPCRVCATTNITLSGEQTIDGVAVVTDDRVLVTGQTDASENGIYNADTGAWARAKDWDGKYDILKGTTIRAHSGTSNAGYWIVTTADPITIGTTNVAFTSSGTIGDFSDTTSAANGDAKIGVKRTDTGMVATTQHLTNESRRLYVSDMATPIDGTTDATTELNLALALSNVTLELKPGTTFMTTGLTVAGDNVRLIMNGATLKLSVLASLDYSPIINITGDNFYCGDGIFDGQQSSQPADGFSDSFAGRSRRAAIVADGLTNGVATLTVKGCEFKNTYGGGVIVQDVDDCTVDGNDFHDCLFEAFFHYQSTGTADDLIITNNKMRTTIDSPPSEEEIRAIENALCSAKVCKNKNGRKYDEKDPWVWRGTPLKPFHLNCAEKLEI